MTEVGHLGENHWYMDGGWRMADGGQTAERFTAELVGNPVVQICCPTSDIRHPTSAIRHPPSRGSARIKLAGNHDALNLGSSFIDLRHLGVAEIPLDRVVSDVSITTE